MNPSLRQRSLTLNNTGGEYYTYFFTPPGDNNFFSGIGVPQLGVEVLGHSENDYTRYSVAVVSNSNGLGGLPANQAYDVYANFNQSFEASWFGRQQVGVYGFFGESPTYFQTQGGNTTRRNRHGESQVFIASAPTDTGM